MKHILSVLLIISLIIMAGCTNIPEDIKYYDTSKIQVDYPACYIFRAHNELSDFIDKNVTRQSKVDVYYQILEQYNEAFFKTKSVIMVLLYEGSGSYRLQVDSVKKHNDKISVGITRLKPQVGTDDMRAWTIFIEKDRTYLDGIENQDIILNIKDKLFTALPRYRL